MATRVPIDAARQVRLQMELNILEDGNEDRLQKLLADGGRLDLYTGLDNMVPLQHAAAAGQAKVVAAMIAAGAQVQSCGNVGATALHFAAENGHVEACRVLVEAGASRWVEDRKGCTPMVLAAKAGQAEVIRFFMNHPFEIPQAWCTVSVARQTENELREVLKVLAGRSNVQILQEVMDRIGRTPELVNQTFWDAVRTGSLPAARHLVQQGADWCNPPGGRSMLQIAHREAPDLKRFLRSLRTGAQLDEAMGSEPAPCEAAPKRESLGML